MADASAYCANTDAVYHSTGVTMVPVLVHKLFLSNRECAELIAEAVFIGVFCRTVVIFVSDFVDPVAVVYVVQRSGSFPWWARCSVLTPS